MSNSNSILGASEFRFLENDFEFTQDGNLIIPFERSAPYRTSNGVTIITVPEEAALDSSGNLKEGFFSEEFEFELEIENTLTQRFTRSIYYTYPQVVDDGGGGDSGGETPGNEIKCEDPNAANYGEKGDCIYQSGPQPPTEEPTAVYLPFLISYNPTYEPCSFKNLDSTYNVYIKKETSNDTIFGKPLYNDQQGKLINDFVEQQGYRYITLYGENHKKRYYEIKQQVVQSNQDAPDDYYYYIDEFGFTTCTPPPTVYRIDVEVSQNKGNESTNKAIMCDRKLTGNPSAYRYQFTVYVTEDPNKSNFTIADKVLYNSDGTRMDINTLSISTGYGIGYPDMIKSLDGNDVYLLRQVSNTATNEYFYRVESQRIFTCGDNGAPGGDTGGTTYTDCDLLSYNISPTEAGNPSRTEIVCNERYYIWDGSNWINKPDPNTPGGDSNTPGDSDGEGGGGGGSPSSDRTGGPFEQPDGGDQR
jgi:hypothetical protein